jgi:NADH-quinone oxidoreductase subunit N
LTDAIELILILPEIILALVGLLILLVDLFYLRRKHDGAGRSNWLGYAALIALVVISLLSYFLGQRSLLRNTFPQFFTDLLLRQSAFSGTFLMDGITQFFRVVFLLVAALVLLLSLDRKWGDHEGEYFALLILSVLGMSLMAAAGELITIYIALELTSISLYLLAAFDFRRRSTEAGLKYFIFGGFSSALLLYGLSLVYGFSGTTTLTGIAEALRFAGGWEGLIEPSGHGLLLGIAFLVAGFGFKLALVPFHSWTPDVYEGAPGPIAAFISTGSKAASFVVVTRIFQVALSYAGGSALWDDLKGWTALLAILAGVTFTAANLMALPQRNVKRLLAYSSIAHAGYMLIGVLLQSRAGVQALFYYIFAYVVTNVGAFASVIVISRLVGGEEIEHFAGLSKRSLPLAGALTVLFFSLGGVPPLAGFFAKFWLFWATFEAGPGLYWLAILGLGNTIIAFFYYLRVLRAVWFDQPEDDSPLVTSDAVSVVLLASSILVILLGVIPQLVLNLLEGAVRAIFPI